MDSIHIDILNPKAQKLIQDLADLKLIAIRKNPENRFLKTVQKFRAKTKNTTTSLEEITREVEWVRSKRYARKK